MTMRTRDRLRDLHVGDQIIVRGLQFTVRQQCADLDGYRFTVQSQGARKQLVTCVKRPIEGWTPIQARME